MAFAWSARGSPQAHNVDMRKDVDTMKKDDLMRYARELGVEIRQAGPNGKKTKWRAVDDVKKDFARERTTSSICCRHDEEGGRESLRQKTRRGD